MALGFRSVTALLVLPFATYAVASVVQSYRPIVGATVAKTDPLPPAEDYAKGRDRTARIGASAQVLGQTAFTYSDDEIPTEVNLPDDMRKLARGTVERNQIWGNLRLFLINPKEAKYKGTLTKKFQDAGR